MSVLKAVVINRLLKLIIKARDSTLAEYVKKRDLRGAWAGLIQSKRSVVTPTLAQSCQLFRPLRWWGSFLS
jgi:hypothetical protein